MEDFGIGSSNDNAGMYPLSDVDRSVKPDQVGPVFNYDMSNVNTSIVFTHSHRLRCIFTLLCGDKYDSSVRFKNNSVILLRLFPIKEYVPKEGTKQFKYDINLLVNGADDDSEKKEQWCLTQMYCRHADKVFTSIRGENDFKSLRPYVPRFSEEKQEIKIENIEHIYLVRHGKAQHNEKNYGTLWHTMRHDTKLLDDQESVKDAASNIYNFMIRIKTTKITTLCVSDLQRTQQTFEIFMEQFIKENNTNAVLNGEPIKNPAKIDLPSRVIVLPCSHELSYVENGRCDGDMKQQFNIKSPFTAENRTAFRSPNLETSMSKYLVKNQELYDNMYGSTKRSFFNYINPFKGNNRCRFTSFLEILVEYNSKISQQTPTSQTSNQQNNLLPSSSPTRKSEISYQENESFRDSSRHTEIWSPKPAGNGGRSRRKSRRKSIRKRSKKRRK